MKKRVKRKGRPSVIEKNTADFNKEFRSESVSRVGVEREREREKELKGRKKKKKKERKEGEIGKFSPFFSSRAVVR